MGCGTSKDSHDGDPPQPDVGSGEEDGRRTVREDGLMRLKVALMEYEDEGEVEMEETELAERGITALSPIIEVGSGGEEEMGESGREEEGDGKASRYEVAFMTPRSPSFKEYWTSPDGKNHATTSNPAQMDGESSQSSDSNQKCKKGRGFRRAIMNLVVIKSSPSSSSSQARS